MLSKNSPLRRFKVVAELIWNHLNLPPLTPVQREMCDWLEKGPKRSQMHAFRGAGKSYLTSAYAIWLLLVNPEEKILVISASKQRADDFTQFSRRLIDEIPLFNHLVPRRDLRYRDSAVSFDVGCCVPAHSPSVSARGITGQLAGSRASTIILDDVEIPVNSETPAKREKLAEAIKEVDAILLPENKELNVNPKVRVLGTPQSMETIYLQLEERGYIPRVWPVQVPDEKTRSGYRGHLAPSIEEMYQKGLAPGTPTDRFSADDIAERRISYGAMGFALQFMLSTALSDAEKYPLKCRDALVAPFSPERVREGYVHSNATKYLLRDLECPGMTGDGFYSPADEVGAWVQPDSTILCVDPSGRGKDETAFISLSATAGYIFVHRVAGSLSGYDDATLVAIAEEARRVKANKILIEANYGDGMFTRLLQPVLQRIYPVAVEEIKNTLNKERRMIDTLSPVLEGHKLVFHESIPKADTVVHEGDSDTRARDRRLFYQMTHLTHERGCLAHDDRLDCLSMGVAHLAAFMSMDARSEARSREEERMRRLLEPWEAVDNQMPTWADDQTLGGQTLVDPLS